MRVRQPFVFSFFSGWFDILALCMAIQLLPVSRRSLRKQMAQILKDLGRVNKLWEKEGGTGTQPSTMEAYLEAANKCVDAARAFMQHARLFAEAKRAHELWRREIELVRIRKEIDALKLVIPLLMERGGACQIEYVSGASNLSIPCGKPVVAQCAGCGVAICSICRRWYCSESFCETCHDCYITNSCVKKPVGK